MENTLEEQKQVCSCGRNYSHCKACGSRNVYVKKFRSMEERVTVFGCRRCSEETSETTSCKAPRRDFSSAFTPVQKQLKPTPGGMLVPGTDEHFNALLDWVREKQAEKGWSAAKTFVEALKAGWDISKYPMDDEVKLALQKEGLLGIVTTNGQQKEAPMRGAQDTQSPPVTEALSLDEVIKNMQEESKS